MSKDSCAYTGKTCDNSISSCSLTLKEDDEDSKDSVQDPRKLSFGTVCIDQHVISSPSTSETHLSQLFMEIENLQWDNVLKRIDSHPEEVRMWAKIRMKSSSEPKTHHHIQRLPLHHACLKLRTEYVNKNLAVSAVQKLLKEYPEAAALRENRHGCLPLHLVAYASSWKGKIEMTDLSNSLPSSQIAVEKVSKRRHRSLLVGRFPGYFDEDALVGLVNALIKAYPKAPKVDSEGGRLPLHMACSGRACVSVVKTLLSAYKSASRHRTKDMSLPIHLAATWGVSSPEVAIALLRAYPDGALGRNKNCRTPLEEALFVAGEVGRENQSTLVRVLRKHPTFWTSTMGRNGPVLDRPHLPDNSCTQLTHFVYCQEWSNVLNRLEAFPEEAQEYVLLTSRSGRNSSYTPLHLACELSPPLQVITQLISQYPASLSRKSTPGGQLPLHLACTFRASLPVVSHLLTCYLKGAQTRDELGNLPIHSACYSGMSALVVKEILKSNPKSVWTTNRAGSTPLDIVTRLDHGNRSKIASLINQFALGNCSSRIKQQTKGKKNHVGNGDLLWV